MQYESITRLLPLSSPPELLRAAMGRPQIGEFHFHMPDIWCAYLFLPPWKGESEIDGVPFPFEPKAVVIVPPGARQRYIFRAASRHFYVHFQTLRGGEAVEITAAQHLGAEFETYRRAFEKVIAFASSNPLRARVHFWDLLWELALRGKGAPADPRGKTLVDQVRQRIDREFADPFSVTELAAHAGVSPTHLTRLFNAATGMSVSRYILDCRIRYAQHLLISTTLPIKAIAHEVGLPDLQHFNKTIRRELGCSPRRYRDRGAKK